MAMFGVRGLLMLRPRRLYKFLKDEMGCYCLELD